MATAFHIHFKSLVTGVGAPAMTYGRIAMSGWTAPAGLTNARDDNALVARCAR